MDNTNDNIIYGDGDINVIQTDNITKIELMGKLNELSSYFNSNYDSIEKLKMLLDNYEKINDIVHFFSNIHLDIYSNPAFYGPNSNISDEVYSIKLSNECCAWEIEKSLTDGVDVSTEPLKSAWEKLSLAYEEFEMTKKLLKE